MPKATVQQVNHYVLTLELSPNELTALQAMVQNPLKPDEDREIAQIRRAIFEACARQRT